MLWIQVLGPPHIQRDERRVPVSGPQRVALLGVLAVRCGTVVPYSELVDELWGEAPPGDAPNAVRAHVCRLRSILDGAEIVSAAGGYRLDAAACRVDVAVFERLVTEIAAAGAGHAFAEVIAKADAALGLWTGPPFASAPEASLRRRAGIRLEEQRRMVVTAFVRAHFRLGTFEQAVARLREELAADPGWERGCALLIEALARTGRSAEAQDAYRRTCSWLRHQHQLPPGPRLQRLNLAVSRHQIVEG
ncbi:hypothetical protein D5S18_26440 [Nocardia panacis]|uniref:OmpR/PhoB-type domain-containing protein n=2 Tax=Nocardia panacis TaxID=2340916 RepID=A0A3A4KD18_9NOCA|nr:hypothetical protein D5S18_26440 [Nocardia panacis]